MSTRSAIIEKTDTGYRGIYVHHDGYREGVGKTLSLYYTNPERVSALVDLGDLSSLGKNINPTGPHSFDKPEKGVTVAYMRDRGEDDCQPTVGKTIKKVAERIGHDGYVYVFKGDHWLCNGRRFKVILDEDEE